MYVEVLRLTRQRRDRRIHSNRPTPADAPDLLLHMSLETPYVAARDSLQLQRMCSMGVIWLRYDACYSRNDVAVAWAASVKRCVHLASPTFRTPEGNANTSRKARRECGSTNRCLDCRTAAEKHYLAGGKLSLRTHKESRSQRVRRCRVSWTGLSAKFTRSRLFA